MVTRCRAEWTVDMHVPDIEKLTRLHFNRYLAEIDASTAVAGEAYDVVIKRVIHDLTARAAENSHEERKQSQEDGQVGPPSACPKHDRDASLAAQINVADKFARTISDMLASQQPGAGPNKTNGQ